jgi:osmotically-inducible protein OsmY
MASKWKRQLPVIMILAACVLLPSVLSAQQSQTGQSQTGQSNQTGQSSQTGQSTAQLGQVDIASQTTGAERFLRENRDPGQMVGGGGQGVGNLRGQTDTAGQGSSGMFGSQGGFGSTNQFGNSFFNSAMSNAMSRQRQQLRVPLRLGPNGVSFSSAPRAAATGPNLRVQNHLARIPQLKDRASVQVEMVDKVAVLRGEVASQHERDLVARLVLLEPGIVDVRNELELATPAPAKPSPTP